MKCCLVKIFLSFNNKLKLSKLLSLEMKQCPCYFSPYTCYFSFTDFLKLAILIFSLFNIVWNLIEKYFHLIIFAIDNANNTQETSQLRHSKHIIIWFILRQHVDRPNQSKHFHKINKLDSSGGVALWFVELDFYYHIWAFLKLEGVKATWLRLF